MDFGRGLRAQDVVPMMVVSASNAAHNFKALEQDGEALAQLESLALLFLDALESSDCAAVLKRACTIHLPRLFIEFSADMQIDTATKTRQTELLERLKTAAGEFLQNEFLK